MRKKVYLFVSFALITVQVNFAKDSNVGNFSEVKANIMVPVKYELQLASNQPGIPAVALSNEIGGIGGTQPVFLRYKGENSNDFSAFDPSKSK